jgi:hypothetical protein
VDAYGSSTDNDASVLNMSCRFFLSGHIAFGLEKFDALEFAMHDFWLCRQFFPFPDAKVCRTFSHGSVAGIEDSDDSGIVVSSIFKRILGPADIWRRIDYCIVCLDVGCRGGA